MRLIDNDLRLPPAHGSTIVNTSKYNDLNLLPTPGITSFEMILIKSRLQYEVFSNLF